VRAGRFELQILLPRGDVSLLVAKGAGHDTEIEPRVLVLRHLARDARQFIDRRLVLPQGVVGDRAIDAHVGVLGIALQRLGVVFDRLVPFVRVEHHVSHPDVRVDVAGILGQHVSILRQRLDDAGEHLIGGHAAVARGGARTGAGHNIRGAANHPAYVPRRYRGLQRVADGAPDGQSDQQQGPRRDSAGLDAATAASATPRGAALASWARRRSTLRPSTTGAGAGGHDIGAARVAAGESSRKSLPATGARKRIVLVHGGSVRSAGALRNAAGIILRDQPPYDRRRRDRLPPVRGWDIVPYS
jgi:hypothetical protein